MASAVAAIPAAPSAQAIEHFSRLLTLETDCWDVHQALSSGVIDFVLLDVRSPELYAAGHVPGAISLPHRKIIASVMKAWPDAQLFVVYCAGTHCNGADKAALALARLGRGVKIMIGGATGWVDEGFALATGSEPGTIAGPAANQAAATPAPLERWKRER